MEQAAEIVSGGSVLVYTQFPRTVSIVRQQSPIGLIGFLELLLDISSAACSFHADYDSEYFSAYEIYLLHCCSLRIG